MDLFWFSRLRTVGPPSGICSSFKPFAEIVGDGYSCLASMPAGRLGMLHVQIDPKDTSLGDPLSKIVFQLVTQQERGLVLS